MVREALLYERKEENKVRCGLCAHRCVIAPGKRGICAVRENRDGVLHTLVYGALIAGNVDPIEKKPLFHLHPGSKSFSIATAGCNFSCTFCQNADISQLPREGGLIQGHETPPAVVVESAVRSGSRTIAYTYTEPTIFFEYALDIARMATGRGLENVFVTNGYMTPEALDRIGADLHGANVDLKSFSDEFYRKRCGARLEPVLTTLREMKRRGIWVEVTTLVIPGLNDSDGELREIASFLVSLGPEIPWHISRFHPRYRLMSAPATPVETIHRAVQIGKEAGLKYVYSGNVPGDAGESTACASCGKLLIRRWSFTIVENRLQGGVCPQCGTRLDGIF
ncbi:MAG TPA: AmmeMemoRadiSam system radical SAM enzyme [Syntrophales bacterium]|nr:AmmeMemoRadiSam system radical SAM enzyme [Syntrophales bacterium]